MTRNVRFGATGGHGQRMVEAPISKGLKNKKWETLVLPKRPKKPVSKAVWTPTSVLSNKKQLGQTFASGMTGGAGATTGAATAGVRGQRAAQAVGAATGKASTPAAKTMGAVKPLAASAVGKAFKGKGIERAHIKIKEGSKVFGDRSSRTLHATANGKDQKGTFYDMRGSTVDEANRRTKKHPIPAFSPYKVKADRNIFGDSTHESSYRGYHRAPGVQATAAGAAVVGGSAVAGHHADKKQTASKADGPPAKIPRRQFDPEARRQRQLGEGMGAGTVIGIGAGASAGQHHLNPRGPGGKKLVKLKTGSRVTRGTVGRAGLAVAGLGAAESMRRSANSPRNRRWN